MKLIASFVALMVISASVSALEKMTAEQKQEFLSKLAKECSEEIGFDFNAAMKLLLGDFTDSSDKAKCFLKCFFKKEGFINDADHFENEFIADALLDSVTFKREKLVEIVNKCTKVPSENSCDAAFKLFECYAAESTAQMKAK